MKDKLIIIGAGGHGKVVADIALKMDRWKSVSFLDDNESISSVMGITVLARPKDVERFIADYSIIVGIGNNTIREQLQADLQALGATIPVLVHPSAVIGQSVEMKPGTVVMPGVVINCCTKIGNGCIINTAATIDHDNIIENYVHVSPGSHLAGNVKVGHRSWLGIGSTVSNNVTITGECTIGAGAVVVNDIQESGTYVGVPARRLLSNNAVHPQGV